MNKSMHDVISRLTPSAQKALMHFASSPEDATEWHTRISFIRTAIRIGAEIMIASGHADEVRQARGALEACVALETTLIVLEKMHADETGTMNVTRPKDSPPTHVNGDGTLKFRPLDLERDEGKKN